MNWWNNKTSRKHEQQPVCTNLDIHTSFCNTSIYAFKQHMASAVPHPKGIYKGVIAFSRRNIFSRAEIWNIFHHKEIKPCKLFKHLSYHLIWKCVIFFMAQNALCTSIRPFSLMMSTLNAMGNFLLVTEHARDSCDVTYILELWLYNYENDTLGRYIDLILIWFLLT